MPPKRKRMKLQIADAQNLEDAPVSEPTVKKKNEIIAFMSMNDDCIRSILEELPLKEFCAVSETCTRLKYLATKLFMHCHKEKVLTIDHISQNGALIKKPKDEEYIKLFGNNIQNVKLGRAFQTKATLRELNKIYKTENMTPIKTLCIDGWGRGLRTTFGQALVQLVKEVESVTIVNTKVNGDLCDCLLKHMPNLKRLTLLKELKEPVNDEIDWMTNECPKLEYLAWHLDRELSIDKVKVFLALNPNLKFFSLLSNSSRTIANLINEDIHVNELFIKCDANIPQILDYLRILCENQLCDRLHLKFPDGVRRALNSQLDRLVALGPYIEGLYFENITIDNHLAHTIITFDQLKSLQLNISKNARLLCQTPKLEEIFAYWGVNRSNFNSYHDALFTYISQTVSLKKIYVRNNSQPFSKFDFKLMDRERFELDDASKVNIYFKSEESSFTGKLNANNDVFCMIEVLRVETEHVNNPLITEYLTTKQISIDNPWVDRRRNAYRRRQWY